MARTARKVAVSDEPPVMDYPAHQRQYNRFLHLTKWFVIHLAVLVLALYFLIIAGQGIFGTVLLLIAIGLLGYGIMSTGAIRHDIEAAVESAGHPEAIER